MPSTTGLRPTDLRVSYDRIPRNLDPSKAPQFGWRLPTDRHAAPQTAYRIVVGEDSASVASGDGDIWDSGVVESAHATNVTYQGPDLASDATYFWTVKVWTEDGETEWPDPERFETALRPEDWRGEWIAHQPGVGDTNGWRSRWRPGEADAIEWLQVDLGERRELSTVTLHPASPVDVIRTPDDTAVTMSWDENPIDGFGFPVAYRVEVADDPDFEDATVVAAVEERGENGDEETEGQPERTATPRTHDAAGVRGRYVRVTATELFEYAPSTATDTERAVERVDAWGCFALAGLTVSESDEGPGDLAEGCSVSASSTVESDTWGREHLTNGQTDSRTASESPLLRTSIDLDGPIARARIHVAAVGYGELYVNGERVGDRQLDPAWTDYERRVLYSSHDVTEFLGEGENALGLWLGRGWFGKHSSYWVGDGSPRARLTMTVEFEDGTTRTIASHGDWGAAASPMVENDIYDGERYDARLEQPGWATPGFDENDWDPAAVVDGPGGALRPQRIQPMKVVETVDVDAVEDHPDGPILDFGQNLTGWLAIEIDGATAGDEITLRHAEALTEAGELSTTDLRSADATDTYVARGDDVETYEPRFTYHGFRYAQVSGYPGEFDPEAVTARVVHTAMDRRGEFTCSNEDLNQVQHNAVWGLRGNTHSIPEDCPQRDERFGWTGDAQISTRALLFNFDAVRFEEKWTRDHADAASDMGYVPDVIPNKATEDPADPTWSVTRVMIPWHLYRHDGDERVLRAHYEGICAYADYWYSVTDEGILGNEYGKFGDWLAFENTDGRRGLPHDLFNTAFLYQVTDTVAKIAEVLGNDVDADEYRARAETIAEAFDERFFDREAGVYGPGTQSSFAVPLFVGLVPDAERERVVANLVEKVEADGRRLKTGFLGTRPLIHTLGSNGYPDLAYGIVSQPERPGWVYMARNGATTMWERWNSDENVGSGMNSLNHSPFTHVSEFFYEVLAGIRVGDEPITEHVTIAPAIVDDLDWVDAAVETPTGELAVAWRREDDGYELSVTVPWNTEATVRLPDSEAADVAESGRSLSECRDGVSTVADAAGDVTVVVGAGSYSFEVTRP